MRSYGKYMIVMLVLLGFGLPMILQGPDGKAIMTLEDWLPSDSLRQRISSLFSSVSNVVVTSITADEGDNDGKGLLQQASQRLGGDKLYKWQDEKGRWHFSDEKPLNSQLSREVIVEPMPVVENLIQAPVVREPSGSNIRPSSNNAPSLSKIPSVGLSISPSQAGQLLKQVEQISKKAEERKALLDQ